jgi:hypothetical protein
VTDKGSSDTETDSGTDTEDVESFMFSHCSGERTDIFEIQCSVKSPCPTYLLPVTFHGMPIVSVPFL